ncbi:MAG: phosphate signaling complex PhoU family protein [Alphaproteobacteria bacterium]
MQTTNDHIVRSFTDDLNDLSSKIGKMGGQAEAIFSNSTEALVKRDADLGLRAIEADRRVDALDAEVEAAVVRMLALRQPMAIDLRAIISAFKIAQALERIADHSKNNAKRA